MKTNFLRIKMKHLVTATIFVLGSTVAQAGLIKKQNHADSHMTEKAMASADASINFAEWESEFNESLKEAKPTEKDKSCQGKNCKFKEMQALDSSFEF